MPRYFFHIDDGVQSPDTVGTELPNLNAAKSQAVSSAGEILAEHDGAFWSSGKAWVMHVTDEAGELFFSLHFSAEVPSGSVTYRPAAEE